MAAAAAGTVAAAGAQLESEVEAAAAAATSAAAGRLPGAADPYAPGKVTGTTAAASATGTGAAASGSESDPCANERVRRASTLILFISSHHPAPLHASRPGPGPGGAVREGLWPPPGAGLAPAARRWTARRVSG